MRDESVVSAKNVKQCASLRFTILCSYKGCNMSCGASGATGFLTRDKTVRRTRPNEEDLMRRIIKKKKAVKYGTRF